MRLRTALGALATAPLLALALPAGPAAADEQHCNGVSPMYSNCPVTGTIGSDPVDLLIGCVMPTGGHLTVTVRTTTFVWTVGMRCQATGLVEDGNSSSGDYSVGQIYTLDVAATGTGYFEASLAS